MREADPSDRAQAALLLLPAALLVWPLSPGPLRDVFAAGLATGAGAAALAALPAAALAAWRGWRRPTPALPGLPLLWPVWLLWLAAVLSAWRVPASDTFGRDAALLVVTTGAVLAVAAAGLGADGRRWLVRGLVLVSLLALIPALARGLADAGGLPAVLRLPLSALAALSGRSAGEGYAGVVGNTGELSGAALPGALAGALLFARGGRPWRFLGLAAVLSLLVHAFLAPVLASLLVLLAAAGVAGALELSRDRGERAGWRLLALSAMALPAILGVVLGLRPGAAPVPPGPALGGMDEAAAAAGAAGDLGGLAVRGRIWRATLVLARDRPLLGVGPGQFAAAFPPYRDPVEIELSTHRRFLGAETEVEHAHSDPLLFLAEAGLVGGLAWLALALLAALGALRALRAGGLTRPAAGLGLLAALLGSLPNAHLLANPPASAAAFPLLGVVLAAAFAGRRGAGEPGSGGRPRPSLAARLLPALAFLLLVAAAFPARSLVAHGRALARVASLERPSIADLELAVAEALEARPDSPVARTLRAKMAPLVGSSPRAAVERTQAVLEVRPHHVAAWIDLGVRQARQGEVDAPRRAFQRALALDPAHPIALENLARLELLDGRAAEGLAALERLAADGRFDSAKGLDLGAELLLRGLGHEGEAVLARADRRFAALTGERALALSEQYARRGRARVADAFRAQAHRLWAYEHAARGDFELARRSLYQNLRITRDTVAGGPARVRLEYAAALLLSGQAEEAQDWLPGREPAPSDWRALPEWAREALSAAGRGPAHVPGTDAGAPAPAPGVPGDPEAGER